MNEVMGPYVRLAQAIGAFQEGDIDGAEVAAWEILQRTPFHPHAYRLLQTIYLDRKDWHSLHRVDERCSQCLPGHADVEFRIGTFLLQRGMLDEARERFDRALNYPHSFLPSRMLPTGTVSYARLKHDAEYVRYLVERIKMPNEAGLLQVAQRMDELAAPLVVDPDQLLQLSYEERFAISQVHRRCLYLHRLDIPEQPLNTAALAEGLREYARRSQEEKVVVVDDFFSEKGIAALRDYLLLSTIWHNDNQKGKSYLGAYESNGLRHPLVERINEAVEEEVMSKFPGKALRQMWCYKNIAGSRAIGVHADFSELNINIWLTPNHFNNNANTGGLAIYKRRAPDDWQFSDYNDDADRIESFLLDSAKEVIEYKFNRAVIFDSALFHGSNGADFVDTYEGHRINMTLLFGNRGQSGRM